MIRFARDGFGHLELYITIKGKRYVFKHWRYQGCYDPGKEEKCEER